MDELLEETTLGTVVLKVGDLVQVGPSKPHKHDAFQSRIRAIRSAAIVSVDVYDPKGGIRTVPLTRIKKKVKQKKES